jgi:hypothetical protein
MGYAKRNDDKGWRAVDSADDCGVDETYSENEPSLPAIPDNQKVIDLIRRERSPVFSALDILRQDALVIIVTSTDTSTVNQSKLDVIAIQNFIQGLRDATNIDMSAMTSESEMLIAVSNYYKALVLAAPAALKPKFKLALASK